MNGPPVETVQTPVTSAIPSSVQQPVKVQAQPGTPIQMYRLNRSWKAWGIALLILSRHILQLDRLELSSLSLFTFNKQIREPVWWFLQASCHNYQVTSPKHLRNIAFSLFFQFNFVVGRIPWKAEIICLSTSLKEFAMSCRSLNFGNILKCIVVCDSE